MEAFALAAKHYSIQNLGMCTPFEQLLVALRGIKEEKTGRCVLCVCVNTCEYVWF